VTPDENEPMSPTLEDRIEHVGEITRPTLPVPVVDDPEFDEPAADDVDVLQDAIAAEEKEPEEPVQPWMPIESEQPWAVPLETDEPVHAIKYEAAAVPETPKKSRPAWAVPAGIAGAVVLLVGSAFAIGHQRHDATTTTVASSQRAPTPAQTSPAVITPSPTRVDSAAGSIAPTAADSAFAALRDSIAAADEARRIRRERAAAAEAEAAKSESAPRTYTDSTGKVWYYGRPPAGEQTQQPQQTQQTQQTQSTTTATTQPVPPAAVATPPALPRPDSALKALVPKLDSMVKPKPDTGVKVKPDTGFVRR
jgi:hypothetical protein